MKVGRLLIMLSGSACISGIRNECEPRQRGVYRAKAAEDGDLYQAIVSFRTGLLHRREVEGTFVMEIVMEMTLEVTSA